MQIICRRTQNIGAAVQEHCPIGNHTDVRWNTVTELTQKDS